MKWLNFERASLPVLLAAGWFCCLPAWGGDAIVFSPDKPKVAPSLIDPEKKGVGRKDQIDSWKDLPSGTPRGLLHMYQSEPKGPKQLSKEEKQMQNQRDEKRNWLLLRPGQLQEEQEEQENQGMPDYEMLREEDSTGKRDYTFHGLTDIKDRRGESTPGRGDSKNPTSARNQNLRSKASEEAESQEKKKGAASDRGPQQGAHIAKELDFRGFFGSDRPGGAFGLSQSEASQRDALGSGGPGRSIEQQKRMELWKREFDRPPSTPAFTKPTDSPSRSTVFGPGPDPGVSSSRGVLSPSWPDSTLRSPTAPRSSASAPAYNPLDSQARSRPSIMRPTVLEVPQRKL